MGAFYSNTLVDFIDDDNDSIIGSLTTQAGAAGFHQQLHTQTFSWIEEINILKSSFIKLISVNPNASTFGILLEYPIARRDKRIDAVIIANNLIIVVEFKVGKSEYIGIDKEQLLDYCLDIRDFHFESRDKIIVPLLVATTGNSLSTELIKIENFVQNIVFANSEDLSDKLNIVINKFSDSTFLINYIKWNESDYSPTPTIVEAARTLYAGKSVTEITRSHAKRINLTKTTDAVINAITLAKASNQKIICFITGVPGAGKTLAGLNIAHHKDFQNKEGSLSTFLSGNVPLIKVLRTALSRDANKKLKKAGSSAKVKESERIIAFIENVHNYFKLYYTDEKIPNRKIANNKIVIFDEAQRAWDAEQSMKKFQRNSSEPEMMFEIMNRHDDWAVIVALVGGGQEINTGEAGLPEWGRVIEEKYNNWKVYISPQLKIGDHSTGNLTLFNILPKNVEIIEDPSLHLNVSLRSYKAEDLSNWVSLVLTDKSNEAKEIFKNKLSKYPIVLTRDLEKAKSWLKDKCQGSRRMGLVASSGGRRLKATGLDVRTEFEPAEWFLNDRNDVRSSYYLEIPATEYKVQGLELDWAGVCWDIDLFRDKNKWIFKTFSGYKWNNANTLEKRKYIINKYRVLLTRAREGMIIFIPKGSSDDHTRNPGHYNSIVDYLISCGVPEL